MHRGQKILMEGNFMRKHTKMTSKIIRIVSHDIHLDVAIIQPTEEKPFYTLVTMSMGCTE